MTVSLILLYTNTIAHAQQEATILTISDENFTLPENAAKGLTATLTTFDKNIIENENVTWFLIGGGTLRPSISLPTNSAGQVFVVYTAPSYEDNTMEINLTFDGYFDLPREGDTVRWNLQTPNMENIPELENLNLENLSALLKQYDIDFTLKVPSGASVSGLPPGYSQNGDNYTWSGNNAADALNLVLTGESQANITYGYNPSAGFPWLVVGVLIAVFVVAGVVVIVLRRR